MVFAGLVWSLLFIDEKSRYPRRLGMNGKKGTNQDKC